MVGGLQCLVAGLKTLTERERRGERESVCFHLLQCISATASGHRKSQHKTCGSVLYSAHISQVFNFTNFANLVVHKVYSAKI